LKHGEKEEAEEIQKSPEEERNPNLRSEPEAVFDERSL